MVDRSNNENTKSSSSMNTKEEEEGNNNNNRYKVTSDRKYHSKFLKNEHQKQRSESQKKRRRDYDPQSQSSSDNSHLPAITLTPRMRSIIASSLSFAIMEEEEEEKKKRENDNNNQPSSNTNQKQEENQDEILEKLLSMGFNEVSISTAISSLSNPESSSQIEEEDVGNQPIISFHQVVSRLLLLTEVFWLVCHFFYFFYINFLRRISFQINLILPNNVQFLF